MMSQQNISASTPMGGTLVPGGATFRVWAPRASGVFLNGTLGGAACTGQSPDLLLANDGKGYWTGFFPDAAGGDLYRFLVVGIGSNGNKRDPYARELATDAPFPASSSILRSATSYPWHDAAFVTPDFSNMIVYQVHIGTYAVRTAGVNSTFLDVIGKIPYLVSLGVNVLQPLPVDEVEENPSMGYNGADLFSPDFPYGVTDPVATHKSSCNDQWPSWRKGPFPARIAGCLFRTQSTESTSRPLSRLRNSNRVRRGL
jgi:1,4-alpha-glucan branching enzyme